MGRNGEGKSLTIQWLLERHKKKIHFSQTGCWIWTAGRNADNYGMVRYKENVYLTHRFFYSVFNKVPYGNLGNLHHKCNVTTCINPEHLEVVHPSMHRILHHRKFDDRIVSELVDMYKYGYNTTDLAALYGAAESTIFYYLKRAGVELRNRGPNNDT